MSARFFAAPWTLCIQLLWAILGCTPVDGDPEDSQNGGLTNLSVLEDAFNNGTSGIQVLQQGNIITLLTDDTVGGRHQRMIVRMTNAQTLLIAHNIDIAPRVPSPQMGTILKYFGEYAWNSQGGVIHWTHKDPNGSHVDGWLEYSGVKYQ